MLLSFFTIVAVLLLDIISKNIVKTSMALGESFTVIPGLLNFTYVLNKGAAWGMLSDQRWIFLSFSTVSIIIIAVLLWKCRTKERILRISLSLIFAGGIGNMIDRIFNGDEIFDGAVVDFIEASFIDFPVFNVADSAVVIGAILLLVFVIFIDGKKEKNCQKVINND